MTITREQILQMIKRHETDKDEGCGLEILRLALRGLEAEGLVKAVVTIDECLWFDANESGACMFCDANLHENAMNKHSQLNGETCPVQVCHDALAAFRKATE